MSETINKRWLNDKPDGTGNKIAPRTITTAIQDEQGNPLQDYIDSMIVVSNEDSTEIPEVVNNSSDDIVTFESGDTTVTEDITDYTEVLAMSSGETHKSLFAKISTMFKNIRYLFKILGTTNISALGDGTVTGNINTLNYNYDYLNIRLGKPANYSRVSTYSVGDYCMYLDCIYKCIVDVTTPGDFDFSYWEATDVCNEVDVLNDDVSALNSNLNNRTFFDASSNTSYEMAINALHKSLPDNTGFNGIMLYDGVGMSVCGARYNSTRGTYILMSPIVNTLRKLRVYGNKIYMSEITCNAETSVDIQ